MEFDAHGVQQVQEHLLLSTQSSNVVRGTGRSLYRSFSCWHGERQVFSTKRSKTGAYDNTGDWLAAGNPSKGTLIPVLECGERILQQYYGLHPDVPDHGSLMQCVNNIVPVNAGIFFWVKGSSYSSHVMTTRYYLVEGFIIKAASSLLNDTILGLE